MRDVSWKDFEHTSNNITEDFERMTRIIFRKYYANNQVILQQEHHNPGIETDPIDINGEKVGFQSKYFLNNISYEDILDSVVKVKKYYSGRIDKLIIFCNKDIKENTKNFKKVKDCLDEIKCKYVLHCNNNILDLVNHDERYGKLKNSFFGIDTVSRKMLREKLELTLRDLEPRYSREFHVSTKHEMYLNGILCNEKLIEYLEKKKKIF